VSGIWAVVVTHNRKAKLAKCLAALEAQSATLERVLVVDNASTDGTRAMLEHDWPRVEVLALATNEGGAGGFHTGMEHAHGRGAHWLWLMDDDTVPAADALAELLEAAARAPDPEPPSLLASKVVWTDGRIHPMNFPFPERTRVALAIEGAERGLMPLRFATFVSLLVHRGAIDRHGLPFKHFFIWSDDVEFTSRVLLSGERGYLVPTSVAVHDTETPHEPGSAPPERFYYHVRNTLYMIRGPGRGRRDKLVRCWILASSTVEYLRANPRWASVVAILRAARDGVRPLPRP